MKNLHQNGYTNYGMLIKVIYIIQPWKLKFPNS